MKLSICIPTYNRADFLPIALESVLEQTSSLVEIAICDNGSTDATPKIVQAYLKKHPRIRSFRFEKNVGPDRCFLKSIEIATGEYGWFLGDDDAIERGSLQTVLDALESHPGLSGLSINRKIYDSSLQNELPWEPIYPGLLADRLYDRPEPCIRELFAYFGYMSGQICSRKRWFDAIERTADLESLFNAYSILAVIVKVIQAHPRWLYCQRAAVKYRADNDSFAKELGLYKRFLLDAVGYESLASQLFGRYTPLYRSCLNQVAKIHIQRRLANLKQNKTIRALIPRILFVLLPRYFATSSFWLYNCPLLFAPRFLLPLARNLYRSWRK